MTQNAKYASIPSVARAVETPLWAVETPLWAVETPPWAGETPLWVVETPPGRWKPQLNGHSIREFTFVHEICFLFKNNQKKLKRDKKYIF